MTADALVALAGALVWALLLTVVNALLDGGSMVRVTGESARRLDEDERRRST